MKATTTPAHESEGCSHCRGGYINGQACPFCTHPLSPAGLASIGWKSPDAEHEPADRDALALAHMTHEQFGESMARWVALGRPLDQQTLDYIA